MEKLKQSSVPITYLKDQKSMHEPKNKKVEERKAMLKHLEEYSKYENLYSQRDSQKNYLESHLNMRYYNAKQSRKSKNVLLGCISKHF